LLNLDVKVGRLTIRRILNAEVEVVIPNYPLPNQPL